MKNILIAILFLLPVTVSAQLLRAYGVVEIGSTFPTSSSTGAKFAYRVTDSSYYRWIHTNTWVKILESSIDPDTLYLKQLSGTTALVNGDTIDISTYFLKSDTTSAFASYLKRPVGWGLSLLTGKYPFVDSSKVASRYYVSTNPTTIAANYAAVSNGTNLIARNLFDNNTYVGILNSKPFSFGTWTLAGRPTGSANYFGWRDGTNFEWYNGTRWATGLESTFARGTATRVPFFDANGQITDDASARYIAANRQLRIGSTATGSYTYSGVFVSGEVRADNGFNLRGTGANDAIFSGFRSGSGGAEFVLNNSGVFAVAGSGAATTSSVNFIRSTNLSTGSVDFTVGVNLSGGAFTSGAYTGVISGFSDLTNLGNSGTFPLSLRYNSITLSPNYRNAGDKMGVFFNPNVGAEMSGSKIIAWQNVVGDAYFSTTSGSLGVRTTSPQRLLHVNGEARITDLTTDPPTRIVGADADGDLAELALGGGLSISSGVLSATGTDTWLGTRLAAGNVSINAGGNSLEILNVGAYAIESPSGAVIAQDDTESSFNNPEYVEMLAGTQAGITAVNADEETTIFGKLKALRESYHVITSTLSPQTLSLSISDNLINQGGTQATFTLNMPASPEDGQVCYITFNNAISTLTIDGNGETIVGSAVTTGVAGSQRKFKFYSGIGWIKQY